MRDLIEAAIDLTVIVMFCGWIALMAAFMTGGI